MTGSFGQNIRRAGGKRRSIETVEGARLRKGRTTVGKQQKKGGPT